MHPCVDRWVTNLNSAEDDVTEGRMTWCIDMLRSCERRGDIEYRNSSSGRTKSEEAFSRSECSVAGS